MFKHSKKQQEAIITIKINEIEASNNLSDKDKKQVAKYYRKQLKALRLGLQ